MITCSVCGREYDYVRKAGHTLTKCNSCMVNTRRFAIKKRAIEYKGGKCSICGYDKCKQALEFHHRDDTEKEFNISGLHSIRWERIQRELDKCDLLCANCHREVHSTE